MRSYKYAIAYVPLARHPSRLSCATSWGQWAKPAKGAAAVAAGLGEVNYHQHAGITITKHHHKTMLGWRMMKHFGDEQCNKKIFGMSCDDMSWGIQNDTLGSECTNRKAVNLERAAERAKQQQELSIVWELTPPERGSPWIPRWEGFPLCILDHYIRSFLNIF